MALEQNQFDTFLLEKYDNYETIYSGIHHYESNEIRDSNNNLIFPKGVRFQVQNLIHLSIMILQQK